MDPTPSANGSLLSRFLNTFLLTSSYQIGELFRLQQRLQALAHDVKAKCQTRSITRAQARKLQYEAFNVEVVTSLHLSAASTVENLFHQFTSEMAVWSAQQSILSTPLPQSSIPMDATSERLVAHIKNDNHNNPTKVILKQWSQQHMSYLFPSRLELLELATTTCLGRTQIKLWFRNARTRSGWSKLYNQMNKDRHRLELLLNGYHSKTNRNSIQDNHVAQGIVEYDQAYRSVESVLRWFRIDKREDKSTRQPRGGRAWIKDVLCSSLGVSMNGTPTCNPWGDPSDTPSSSFSSWPRLDSFSPTPSASSSAASSGVLLSPSSSKSGCDNTTFFASSDLIPDSTFPLGTKSTHCDSPTAAYVSTPSSLI